MVRISATDGFSAYIAAPAAAQVQRDHPNVAVEIVAATRRATQQRSGLDVEVVVGEPKVHRAKAIRLGDYCLGLYGSRDYLVENGTPTSIADLARYPLVYFIDSMLQVDDLDVATSFAPAMRESVTSTNVFVHVEATRAAAGIGLLPCFMADRHDDLVRVLPDEVAVRLTYWLVTRAETLRRPEVAAVVDAISDRMAEQREVLLGGATLNMRRAMPFIEPPKGRAYYRHWAAAEPRAAVIFLHGFGEHTGVYHRYGFALNAAGIDLWAVDQFGHGLSPGTRGDFGSIDDSSDLADTLTELAEGERLDCR